MKTINDELSKIYRLKLEFINIMDTKSYTDYHIAANEGIIWDLISNKFTLLELETFNTRMNLLLDK